METENIIKQILEEDEESRLYDNRLLRLVYEKYGWKLSLEPMNKEAILIQNLPSLSTITRKKRKIQEEYHFLMPEPEGIENTRRKRQVEIKLKRPEIKIHGISTHSYSEVRSLNIETKEKQHLREMHDKIRGGTVIKSK
ncbi:MAG: hypothetical protein Q8P20_08050 [bacterium]|nr:hypothetical protein [bacterium]MDZ4227893.1 hypothetical protein [Candidatus Levybacteria bacterium]